MTSSAPMFLSAISLMASKTVVSGVTDQMSDPLWCNKALTVPVDFIPVGVSLHRLPL
jgi:hypothetical protein